MVCHTRLGLAECQVLFSDEKYTCNGSGVTGQAKVVVSNIV